MNLSPNYPLTLLSPARDREVAQAAVQAGADAVYIGAPRFSARQAAGNSMEDIAATVAYAHRYGVQVLVALNTLMDERERAEARVIAQDLYAIGVDALIIQDLRLLDGNMPPIRLHASTQCDNRTVEQVLRLERAGFQRVVLARELDIEAIREIRSKTTVELEAFAHGALCVSYSGRCYLSEVLMGRSANRGCCAQMCRMRYDLLDKDLNEILDSDGQPIHQRYLLSLQDMDRSLYLRELIEAGITTFKIEGRLKDRDYVTNVTAYYRELLDNMTQAPQAVYERTFTPNPVKTFHRGATDCFLHGRTPNMANWRTPKSTGEYIGTVTASDRAGCVIELQPETELHNGDGLCFGDQGFSVNRVDRLGENKVHVSIHGQEMFFPAVPFAIFRNLDIRFQKSLASKRRIPVDIVFEDIPSGFRLTIGGVSREFKAEHQPAQNAERALQTVRDQLGKLGDTMFAVRNMDIRLSQPYFIPISQLNQWRRETIENL